MKMKTRTIRYKESKYKDPAEILLDDPKEWKEIINNAKQYENRNV